LLDRLIDFEPKFQQEFRPLHTQLLKALSETGFFTPSGRFSSVLILNQSRLNHEFNHIQNGKTGLQTSSGIKIPIRHWRLSNSMPNFPEIDAGPEKTSRQGYKPGLAPGGQADGLPYWCET
jgi:hypothetical protein